jgi:uncharacterized protein (DUF58 family)
MTPLELIGEPPRPKTRIRLKQPIALVLSFLPFVIYLIDGYRGWLAIFIVFVGAWLIAWLWARALAGGLELDRDRRFASVHVGDPLIERTEIINHGRFPALWVELAYSSDLPDFQPSTIAAVGAFGGTWRRTLHSVCSRRGLYTIGPVHLTAGDPFGLFQVEQTYSQETSLLVVPPIWRFPDLHIPPGGRRGDSSPAARAFDQTTLAASVRTYIPGDDLRRIHWRTTARQNQLFVRQLEHSPSGDWWIYLDLDQSVQSGTGARASEEQAILLAASLADRGLQAGHAVGLMLCGEQLVRIPPGYGQDHYQKIMRELAIARTGRVDLKRLIESNKQAAQHSPSLIVITPSSQSGWVDSLASLMLLGVQPLVLQIQPDLDPPTMATPEPRLEIGHLLQSRGIPQVLFKASDFEADSQT